MSYSLTNYLAIGAIFAGIAMGSILEECPSTEFTSTKVIAVTVAWPGFLVAALFYDAPETECTTPPQEERG